jgi:hypothetical protein
MKIGCCKGIITQTTSIKKASGKKRKNIIFYLERNGENLNTDEEILKHATKFYKDLFGPSDSPIFNLSHDCWEQHEKVTEEENNLLTRPFQKKSVVMNMKRNTAPGPDHMPIEFYQACWEFIKDDMMNLFQDFWTHGLDVDRLNYGVITLITKTKEAAKIQQFRPICLLNVIYKILTKTLMLCFEDCMSRIISRSQNAFIKGRNIMDGVLCLHEILHDTRVKKKDGIVLKLDFEKAYDKISWNFLFEVLKQRGFNETWCRWLKKVVYGGTLSVKVNGNMGSYFRSGKGVRQGDPLSPLLFNLAADSLAKMVQTAQKKG